jgi:endonuclease G
LGGNSGSALINLETGAVLALHFGGSYLETNYGVPAWELARDGRVVDAGVSFTGSPPGGSPPWASWWGRADNTEAAVDPSPRGSGTPPAQDAQAVSTSKGNAQTMADGSIELTMPLHITVRLGGPSASTEAAATIRAGADGSGTALERMVMPDHDENYSTRRGYDPQFLGVAVPMPEAAHPSVVAKAKDGSSVLPYQNFSIVMHKERRLALLTASNVTADPSLKKPEPGHDYTRKGLSGLGPKDQERWFPDPRLDAAFQLPDVFYTSDEGAFDKGHIVRREDAAWGPTYELLKRANGDTYHVTNCSPQVAGFNRSALGEDNWGDLEDHVLKGAASERYCQFTGPILDPKDDVFVGAGGGRVRIRARIPSRFWKVIVVLGSRQDIAAYAFVLEQDLSAVPLQEEFIVPDNFRRFLEPIVDLELKAGVRFPDIVRRADQHDTTEGAELAMRAGIERRSLTEGVIG